MTRLRSALVILAAAALIAIPSAAAAKPRVTVTGDLTVTSTLTAKATGGTLQSVVWERCQATDRKCSKDRIFQVGSRKTYAVASEDVDYFLRAVAKVKPRGGAVRTIRTAWRGPVTLPPTTPGTATGMEVGEYNCTTNSGTSKLWIDSASTYRSASGTPGTYVLEPGTPVYETGAVKINWTSGTYADWQKDPAEPLWSEYIPVGTPSKMTGGAPTAVGKIIWTFRPANDSTWASSGWTTCDRVS